MREARTCYDHLAGRVAAELFERWLAAGILAQDGAAVRLLGDAGFLASIGLDLGEAARERRPLCRACMDWSERWHHLGGRLGAAILSLVLERGWATRAASGRAIRFSTGGERAIRSWSEGRAYR